MVGTSRKGSSYLPYKTIKHPVQQGHVLIPTGGPRGMTEALVVGWRVRT